MSRLLFPWLTRHFRWLCALGVLLTSCLLGTPARAQASAENKAAAEALFDQAMELLKADKLEQACERFEQSQRIDPAVGTLLYLAECYERTGRYASAWATFREAASSAAASGQSERATIGTQRAEKLEPLLSRITYQVGANAELEGFELTQDGKSVRRIVFGVPIPIDPGSHLMHAQAPGHQPWELQVQVPQQASNVEVTVPSLTPAPQEVAPAAPAPAVAAPPPEPATAAPVAESEPAGSDRTWVWVSAGVGVAGLGVGVVFGIKAARHDDDAEQYCDDALCFDPRGEEASNDARDAALIANIGYGVGAAGLLTSLILAVISVEDDTAAGGWQVAPRVSHAGGGIDLRGSF